MSDKVNRKMAAALTGMLIGETWPSQQEVISLVEERLPPSYLVRCAIEQFFGMPLQRPYDKSAWAVPVVFKEGLFEVSDWRRSTWRILGRPDQKEVAQELAEKISSAAKILDGHLKKICRQLLDENRFSLDNQFHRYRALFVMFRDECHARSQSPDLPRGPETFDLARICRHLEASFAVLAGNSLRLHANLLAATIFFFSLSEIIFDACFALGERGGRSYREFRRLEWAERFKLVLPLSEKEVQDVYKKLLPIRRLYRNTPVHADPVFAFHVKGIGLIPATFEDLDNPNMKSLFFTEANDVDSVLPWLSRALEMFEHHPATMFGFAYAGSGLTIHIAEDRVSDFKAHMSSIEVFREFLVEKVEYADAVENMDV